MKLYKLYREILFPVEDDWLAVPVTNFLSKQDALKAVDSVVAVYDSNQAVLESHIIQDTVPEHGSYGMIGWWDDHKETA